MISSTSPADPALSRLILSRKAIVRQMAGGRDNTTADSSHEFNKAGNDQTAAQQGSESSMWQVLTQAFRAWWRYHPVQVAFDIGKPFLSDYARKQPLRLLGVAAGFGAAAVFVKPWRLVSVTGLALALFKSPKLSNTLLSLLQKPSAKLSSGQAQQKSLKDPS